LKACCSFSYRLSAVVLQREKGDKSLVSTLPDGKGIDLISQAQGKALTDT